MRHPFSLALLLCLTTSSGALADRDGYRERYDRGYGPDYRDQRLLLPAPRYLLPVVPLQPRHCCDRYDTEVLDAALIGAAVANSYYYPRDNRYLYTRDSRNPYIRNAREPISPDNGAEVVSCQRIERLSDGRERRVQLPVSDCE